MSQSEQIEVTIANNRLLVPVHVDEETTLGIVNTLNERIAAIEAESVKFNTQHFALLAAYAYAIELDQAHYDHDQEHRELLRRLDKIRAAITRLLTPPESPEADD